MEYFVCVCVGGWVCVLSDVMRKFFFNGMAVIKCMGDETKQAVKFKLNTNKLKSKIKMSI